VTAPAVAIFDVNETLSNLSPLGDRFEELGAPGGLLPAWFAATLRDGIALAASGAYADFREVGRANLLAQLAGVEGLRRTTAEAAEHVLDGFSALSVHPDVPEGFRLLRDADVRIATLTNGSVAIARGLLERAGLEELAERNLDVTGVRRWKPAPEPYLYACRELGVEASEAVLIAAHPWDVHGARRAGLRGAWLDREGVPYPEVFERPDASGRDLPSLVRALLAL
jgi:2-haloacid dehalogenase